MEDLALKIRYFSRFTLNVWSSEISDCGVRHFEGEQEERKSARGSSTITKLTVASYCVTPSRRSDISSQTADEDTKNM